MAAQVRAPVLFRRWARALNCRPLVPWRVPRALSTIPRLRCERLKWDLHPVYTLHTVLDESRLSQSELVYVRVRRAIAEGRYQQGERLGEVALATELGVSRTPVREAIHRLISDGLLTPTRRGVAISRLQPSEVEELYQVRGALEALVAELCARRIHANQIAGAQIAQLQARARAFEAGIPTRDMAAMVGANLRLHQYIAELAGNRPAREALGRIWDNVAVSSVTNLHDEEWVRRVGAQHQQLVDAITQGDPAGAADIARRHVGDAMATYARRMDEMGGGR